MVIHFDDLGIHPGHTAKAAIEAALAAKGLPEDVTVCAAVPTNNWSEADVAPDLRPQFKVTPRDSTKRRPTEGSTSGQVPGDRPDVA